MNDSDLAIRVRGLCKSYSIRHEAKRNAESTLAETVLKRLKNPLARTGETETFHALKDVDFDVKKGDVVGIIGRNGAGKSTLLKILSRITEPTSGRIELYGRIGSLLEVGTGFHPELTGRENIFLNGAILGMTLDEIKNQFDAIVDFAGIAQFLDTPVKRYSSGMYVRLAFAVAAHLRSEILIVDEVLAVGDAEFQRKCIGKLKDVSSDGKTVLLVSHNTPTLSRLCRSAIWLRAGEIRGIGRIEDVLPAYVSIDRIGASSNVWADDAPGNTTVRLASVNMTNDSGESASVFSIDERVGIEIIFRVEHAGYVLIPNIHVFAEDGTYVFVSQDTETTWRGRERPVGTYKAKVWIPPHLLSEGRYAVGVALTTFNPMTVHFFEREAVTFQTREARGLISARGDYHGHLPGVIRPMLEWKTTFSSVRPMPQVCAPNADQSRP